MIRLFGWVLLNDYELLDIKQDEFNNGYHYMHGQVKRQARKEMQEDLFVLFNDWVKANYPQVVDEISKRYPKTAPPEIIT